LARAALTPIQPQSNASDPRLSVGGGSPVKRVSAPEETPSTEKMNPRKSWSVGTMTDDAPPTPNWLLQEGVIDSMVTNTKLDQYVQTDDTALVTGGIHVYISMRIRLSANVH
jgi:hypothetical protein